MKHFKLFTIFKFDCTYLQETHNILINVISSETMLYKKPIYSHQLQLLELTTRMRKTHSKQEQQLHSTDKHGECPWIQHSQPREATGFHLNDSKKQQVSQPYSLLHFFNSVKRFLKKKKKKRLYLFSRERGRKGEREGEQHGLHAPSWGLGPQPRLVP